MDSVVNKIRLNNDLWFTVLGNKLVFGNSALSKEFHYTFSFGNRSGVFDLHLTNSKGKHYTVVEISHKNIYAVLPNLLDKIKNSVFNLSNFDESECYNNDSVIYKIEQFSDVISEFGGLTKKNKIIIDKDSPEFRGFVDKLIEKQSIKVVELTSLKNDPQFFGFIQSKTEDYFIVKNLFFGEKIFRMNDIDLDLNSVFEKILGKNIYESVLDRINDGILYLKE